MPTLISLKARDESTNFRSRIEPLVERMVKERQIAEKLGAFRAIKAIFCDLPNGADPFPKNGYFDSRLLKPERNFDKNVYSSPKILAPSL